MSVIKKTSDYLCIMFFAVMSSINYIIFVFPNSFAPAGLDGICTMIQNISHVNMGYLSLLLNIPLLICAYIFLNRSFARKTLIYILSFSVATILLKNSVISEYCYYTESGSSRILAPIAAGSIRGILYAATLKHNCCSGGMDIVAAIVKKKKPYLNLMNVIFIINTVIALSSYFVYGMRFEPVICSIIYSFITSKTGKQIQSDESETIKFEIITDNAQKMCDEISDTLHLGATVVNARGVYSGKDRQMIICVVDKHTVPKLEELIRSFPDSVVFKSTVNNSQMLTDYTKSGV